MTGPKGPDQPDTLGQEGAKVVHILEFSILACPDCGRDCLFALVEEIPNPQQFRFCTNCGRYFEKGGEPNGS